MHLARCTLTCLALLVAASTALGQTDAKPGDTTVTAVEPTGVATPLPPIFDGPPPPVPPEVISRDERGRATVRAIRLTRGIRLDGKLDEEVYQTVPAITGFLQMVPHEGEAATEKTEAWVMFDESNIYVACRCWDSAPEEDWVANEMRRDTQQLRQGDQFGLLFDTFYDRRNGLQFYTNPLGAIADASITGEGNPNSDWNAIWDVRTGRFDGGWTVEMQIPFKSLRYRPGPSQVWGIQFRRAIRLKNEWVYLTRVPISAGSGFGGGGILRVSAAATLVSLEVPPESRRLEIKPYAISAATTDRLAVPAISNDVDGDVGLDVKYGLTESLTADFTYNTDFAQVEVDEQQVNLTRFNLFFPEKREFFLEGRGIFDFARGAGGGGGGFGGSTAPALFFSRQIGLQGNRPVPIIAGGRLTGKAGRFDIGALSIQTDDNPAVGAVETNFTVVRLKRDILRRSSIGALFTERSLSLDGHGSNQTYGVDGTFSFFENVNLLGYVAKTQTPGLRGQDTSYQGRLGYDADRYGFQIEHLLVGDNFNPEVGFLRRDDFRRNFVAGRFSPRPRSIELVRQFSWEASLDYVEAAHEGHLETRDRQFRFETEFENSDRFTVTVTDSYEFLERPFRIAPGIAVPIGAYRFRDLQASYSLGVQRRTSGNFSVQQGSFFGGDITAVGFRGGRVEMTRQFSLEPSLALNWIELPQGTFATGLAVTRVTYTFTPRMFLSGLLQYNSSNDTVSTNLRLRWEYSPASELFVVYTEDRDTDTLSPRFSELLNRAFVIKFNRLFRF